MKTSKRQSLSTGDLVIYRPDMPHVRHGRFVTNYNDSWVETEESSLYEIKPETMAMFIDIRRKSITSGGIWLEIYLIGDRLVSVLNDVFTPYVAQEESNGV